MSSNFEMLRTERNKQMLRDSNGYLYWKKDVRGKQTRWHCIFREKGIDGEKGSRCPGKSVTDGGQAKIITMHNHLGDSSRVELKKIQGEVQQEAILSREAPRLIIANQIKKLPELAKPFVRRSLMARNIRNHRHKAKQEPANPKSLHDLKIPKEYQLCGNETFLKFDGWNDKERVFIFSTNRCLDLLEAIRKWGCDGTSDVVPLLFDQLWILFVRLAHSYVPVVFVLLNRHLQSSYEFVLRQLLVLRPKLSPTSVAVDFEKAEFNVFQSIFPRVKIRACFFHMQKSIIRQVGEKGCKLLYESNEDFRRQVNLVPALAFVPVDDVSDAFVELRQASEKSKFAEHLESLHDYFEDTYIGRPLGNGRRKKARYLPSTWSVCNLIKDSEPKTSNGIESFNGQMIRTMAASHPTIWKLIEGLRTEFALAEKRVVAFFSGEKTPRRGFAYRHISERIKRVVERYDILPTKLEFLQAVASNLGGMTTGITSSSQVLPEKKRKEADPKKPVKMIKKEPAVLAMLEDENESKECAKQNDLHLLEPKGRLNDNVINSYLKLIVQRSEENLNLPRVLALDTLFYTQLIENGPKSMLKQSIWADKDLFFYDVVLIPIHTLGHWSLAVVKIEKKRVVFYDSLHRDGSHHNNVIRAFLKEAAQQSGHDKLDPENWLCMSSKDIPFQSNSIDCGVFVCQFADSASRDEPPKFSQEDMERIRQLMKVQLLSGKLV